MKAPIYLVGSMTPRPGRRTKGIAIGTGISLPRIRRRNSRRGLTVPTTARPPCRRGRPGHGIHVGTKHDAHIKANSTHVEATEKTSGNQHFHMSCRLCPR